MKTTKYYRLQKTKMGNEAFRDRGVKIIVPTSKKTGIYNRRRRAAFNKLHTYTFMEYLLKYGDITMNGPEDGIIDVDPSTLAMNPNILNMGYKIK